MKVTVLGTGCIWTKRACASYLIDDDIIIDPGSGTLKQLLKSCNTLLHHEKIEKIKLILITHYHSDHYFDIVYLLWKLASEKNPNTNAVVICPPNGEEKIKQLCLLAMGESTYSKLNFEKYIKFIDASKIDKYEYKDFIISPIKLDHGKMIDYGYIVKQKKGKTVSFTGDTCLCENVNAMLKKSDVLFLDMAGTDVSNNHYNIIDGIELMKKYRGKCCIVPCHLTSQALDYCDGKINPPQDLMVLDIDKDIPYEFSIKGDKTVSLLENNELCFEREKFSKIKGKMVDLSLYLTKNVSESCKYPIYCFDVVLHNTSTVIGTVSYTIINELNKDELENISIVLNKGYDLKSVKYECLSLVKKVANFHEAKSLYLTCSPTDFETRKVYEKLGAFLKEIKTFTYMQQDKTRNTLEVCIFEWKLNGKK